ncbi:MAG: hypothetical protein RJQ21_04835 [Rhodospirillales bacterium]
MDASDPISPGSTSCKQGAVHIWILRLFEAVRQPNRFTVSSLEMILTEPQMEIWHETKDRVIRDLDLKRHRASNDALIIQQTWVRTREEEK